MALTQTASSWSLPLRAGAAGSEDGRSSVLSALRQKLLGGRSKRATAALTAMAKVEWLLAPWHRAGKAGSRAGLRWVVGAVGSASTAHLILHGRTPGWGQLLGTDPLEALQYPWGQCCAAVPVLCHLSQTDPSCGEFVCVPFKSFCHSPAEWGVLALTKQEKDRDIQPMCPADLSSVLQGQILPVLVGLCPPGSFHMLVAAGGGTVGLWAMGGHKQHRHPGPSLLSLLSLLL